VLILLLAVMASLGGLCINGLYRDNSFVTAAWYGNDLVTLTLAVPLLIVSLLYSMRNSARSQLVWIGVLDYMLYNYAFYLFGAEFNEFFLIYVVLFTLSMFAMIFGLSSLDVDGIRLRFNVRSPVRWISGYMVFVACGLSFVYIAQSLGFIMTGQLPPIVMATGHPTSVVFALDLSLLVPGLVLGAIWLWKRQPWGYVLAVALNVKGALYTLALAIGSFTASRTGMPEAAAEMPLWIILTATGTIVSIFLLRSCSRN
jgi:hypothetical protein